MNSTVKLTRLIGTKGIDTLKSKNQSWKLSDEQLLNSALAIAQTVKLKSLLETCTKYNGSPFELDASLDINKSDNTWTGKVITKSSSIEIKGMGSDDLCSTIIALGAENMNSFTEELAENVKTLTNSYKPKSVSVLLKKSVYECFVCKSQIKLALDDIKLCGCLDPLQSSDVLLTKSGDKVKLQLSDRAEQNQLRFIIKLITKSLLKNS